MAEQKVILMELKMDWRKVAYWASKKVLHWGWRMAPLKVAHLESKMASWRGQRLVKVRA